MNAAAQVAKSPSKRQQARDRAAARKAQKEAKQLALIEKSKATKAALVRCKELAKAIPTNFSEWGVVRTQAWEVARARCAEVASFCRPHLGKMQAAIGAMERATTAPVERLALDLYGTDEQKAEAAKQEVARV